MIESTFGSRKPIIAMIHLAPLPGSPLYDRAGGMQKIVEDSARDIEALQEGGVDAVMFGNEGDRPIAARAKSAVFSSLADVILVSGPMTGEAVAAANLRVVKDALPDTPVFANTGVNLGNVGDILRIADGAIIGTHFKVDGNTWNPVDGARVKRFMDKVRSLR